MSHWKLTMAALAVTGIAGSAMAAPVINGQLDPIYGPAIALQQNPTGFGNSDLGQVGPANGSELDGAYGFVSGGNLHLFLTGNLESNFNKVEIFFDTIAGGQNKLRGDNVDVDFNGLNRMGDDGSGNGLRFDTGFEADYWIAASGNGTDLFVNYATLPTLGGGTGGFLGQSGYGSDGVLSGGSGPAILFTIDNSNTGGVDGANVNDPSAVTTGIEVVVPLSALGDPADFIRISAFVNGGGHDFVSNQVLGSLAGGTGNLGEPRSVDFSQQPGDQFFTVVVPEPASLSLVALAGLALVARRR